jgi:hypothetical protein
LIGARRGAKSLPAGWAAAFLQLLHEARMVLFDHLAELLDLVILGCLLAKLRQSDLFVVIDNQQGDDARLELLTLQAGAANLARLAWLTRLSKLTRLSWLCWLDHARLRRAGLRGRLDLLCQHQCGAPEQHRARTSRATN